MPSHKTIGVIGLGSIGMRHAKNLIAMGHKVYGQDTNQLAIADLKLLGGHHISMDFKTKEMPHLDGVVVASPTKFHLFHWANTDAPVFIEKPIAQIEDVGVVQDELVAREGEITMMGNNLRFHSCVKWVKAEMEMVGKPLWASFTISQKNTKYTDPCILNWGAHEVDLALHMLGPATVTAAAGNDQCMDVCLLHEYGVPSTIHVDYLAPVERRGFIIIGEKGNISADLVNRRAWFKSHGMADVVFEPTHWEPGDEKRDSWDQDYIDEMQAFIDLIDGKPVPHAATGQDGLHALELILEAQRMAAK